jgi:hypothetical protein
MEVTGINSLGSYLALSREKSGLSIESASMALAVTEGQLQIWELSPQNAPLKTLVEIARLYGAEPMELHRRLLPSATFEDLK